MKRLIGSIIILCLGFALNVESGNKFNYNVLIASLYETYNFFSEIIKKEIGGEVLKANYIKILTS